MAERFSQEEKDYYQSVVEKAAEKGRPYIDNEAELERVVTKIGESSAMHDDLKLRFKRDVSRRIREMWDAAKSEQERRVVKEFEGYVQIVNGKYQPTGVEEEFKITVRPGIKWSWRDLGNIWDGVFGKSVDSEEFHQLIELTEHARDELEKAGRDLELLKAARKSTKELIALGASGFMSRMRQKGHGFFSSMAGSMHDFLDGIQSNKDVKRDMKHAQEKIKKAQRKLEKRETLRDAMLQKVESLREDSRQLFQKTFQKEIDVLLAQKEDMSEAEFERKKEQLLERVKHWEKRTGFLHMEVFFHEAFGEGPGTEEVVSELEAKRRNVLVSRLYKEITGESPTERMGQQIAEYLRIKDPQTFQLIYEEKYPERAVKVLRLLYTGESDGLVLKPKDRVMKPHAEQMATYLRYAAEYDAIAGAHLDDVLKTFAEEWKGIPAAEFDEVFDLILKGEQPMAKEKSHASLEKEREEELKLISEHYKDVTGENVDPDDAEKLLESLKADAELSGRYKRLLKNEKKKNFARVFFQGYFSEKDKPWVANDERLPDPSAEAYFKVLLNVDEIVRRITEDKKEWKDVIEAFLHDPRAVALTLDALDFQIFLHLQAKLRADKEAARKQELRDLEERARKEEKAIAEAEKAAVSKELEAAQKEAGDTRKELEAARKEAEAARREAEEARKEAEKARKEAEERAKFQVEAAAGKPKKKKGKKLDKLLERAVQLKILDMLGTKGEAPPPVPAPAPKGTESREPSARTEKAAEGAEARRREALLARVLGVQDQKARSLLRSLPKNFNWPRLEEYDREAGFLFTGRYKRRDGKGIITLEGPREKWGTLRPTRDYLVRLMEDEYLSALQTIRDHLEEELKASGFSMSSYLFFREYLLKGRKREPVTPSDNPDLAKLSEREKLLAHTLHLTDKPELVQDLAAAAFTEPDFEKLLSVRKNQEMLTFFVTGRYRDLNVGKKKLKKNKENLQDLVSLLTDLNTLSPDEFQQRITEHFSDLKKATMRGFLESFIPPSNPSPDVP